MAITACFFVALGAQAETFNLPDGTIEEGTLVHESTFGVNVGPNDPGFEDEQTFVLDTVGSHVAWLINVSNISGVGFSVFHGDTLLGTGISDVGPGSVVRFSTNGLDLSQDFVRVVFGDSATPSAGTFRVAFIPEPATWLMMILGFGLVGLQLRRRERNAVDFA
jgi:hypothetical protein